MSKTLFSVFLAGLLLMGVGARAQAVEISGNITTLTAYQHDDQDAGGLGAGGLTQGDLGIADAANADHFRFLVDQVEIDVEKELGERFRVRADVDFRDVANTALRAGDVIDLEQGYVTAHMNWGPGGTEFLLGKYNCPIGFESNDRQDNAFLTYTPGYQYLLPTSLIGVRLYHEFSDNWNGEIHVVNNMNGGLNGNSALPSGMLRVGTIWGEEGNQSYINLGGGVGPEHNAAITGASQNRHLDLLGDIWGNFSLGEMWDLGWEAIYRQTNALVAGGSNQKAAAGQLNLIYHVSDVWDVQARAATLWDVNPPANSGSSTTGLAWGGFEGLTYSGTAGAVYDITDTARLTLEYRFDYADPSGAAANADFHTAVAGMIYNF